jgi:hypothetical protein
MKFIKKISVLTLVMLSNAVYADCSYKVINHATPSFEEQRAIGTVGNLLIPRCAQNPSQDKETLENCATNASNTLYEHPHEEGSCTSTKGKFVNIQFSDREKLCKSSLPSSGGNVVLYFPEDFKCNFSN